MEQQGRWERSELAGTVVPSGWRAAHLFSESESEVAQLCPTLCDPVDYIAWNSPDQNTGVGSQSLLQGIFPTQGSNPGLPHCRQTL